MMKSAFKSFKIGLKLLEIWLVDPISVNVAIFNFVTDSGTGLYNKNPYRQNNTNFMILIVHTLFTGNKKIRTLN